jgi:hypothetical protein
MLRTCTAFGVAMIFVSSSAFADTKKKSQPAPKTFEQVVVDIVTAPVKVVDDLLKPLQPKPEKKK